VWQKYLETRGSLHVALRLEAALARLSVMVNHALGGHARFEDFVYSTRPQATELAQQTLSPEDAFKLLTGLAAQPASGQRTRRKRKKS
jgi:hypothetical protein